MYLKEKTIKILRLKNVIFTIIGVFSALLCASYIISEFVYYRNDPYTALHAVSMASSIKGVIIGSILLITAAISRNLIGNSLLYSSYFEGDLDGYITYHDLAEVTGKNANKIRRQLHLFRRVYMKNYELKEKDGEELVELYSKISLCECRNCAAHIEKKIFFTGICPYCGSADLFAKVLTDERFYSISNEFASGMEQPAYYTSRHLSWKKMLFKILLVLGLFVAIIALIMTLNGISNYFDQEYQKKILFSPENHLSSYALIKADILDTIIYDATFFLVFGPLAILRCRKTICADVAGICADFFSRCKTPFVKARNLPSFGVISKEKTKLQQVRRAIRHGYLLHCTLEMHEGNLMAVLAKKIVKDKCPSCAAPIVGAVDENYVCNYCGNLIMGVIERR